MARGRGRAVREKRPSSGSGRAGKSVPRISVEELPVTGGFITLGQLLKRVGVIQTGGEARTYLGGSGIRVNGEVEERRGRKLVPGDRVDLPGRSLRLTTAPAPDT